MLPLAPPELFRSSRAYSSWVSKSSSHWLSSQAVAATGAGAVSCTGGNPAPGIAASSLRIASNCARRLSFSRASLRSTFPL